MAINGLVKLQTKARGSHFNPQLSFSRLVFYYFQSLSFLALEQQRWLLSKTMYDWVALEDRPYKEREHQGILKLTFPPLSIRPQHLHHIMLAAIFGSCGMAPPPPEGPPRLRDFVFDVVAFRDTLIRGSPKQYVAHFCEASFHAQFSTVDGR